VRDPLFLAITANRAEILDGTWKFPDAQPV
jgi:hypothetical protein